MKKFFAMIAIASVVLVSCGDAATDTKTDAVKPVENVTPPATDTASAKPAMPDTTAKPAVTDTAKKATK
jgi:PBP1b-binding outer membrane lipoprotein LpoB